MGIAKELDRFGMIDAASGHNPLYWGRTNDVQPWGISGEEYVRLSDYASLISEREEMVKALRKLDRFWSEPFPAGPDGSRDYLGGLGLLSDDTVELWREVRALLSRIGEERS